MARRRRCCVMSTMVPQRGSLHSLPHSRVPRGYELAERARNGIGVGAKWPRI